MYFRIAYTTLLRCVNILNGLIPSRIAGVPDHPLLSGHALSAHSVPRSVSTALKV